MQPLETEEPIDRRMVWDEGEQRLRHRPLKAERLALYAAKMRAGLTPAFQRRGSGTWGTGPQRRELVLRAWETRRKVAS